MIIGVNNLWDFLSFYFKLTFKALTLVIGIYILSEGRLSWKLNKHDDY